MTWWETADVLADALKEAGYASIWQQPGTRWQSGRGAVAGVWEGGQLDEREADDLSAFCRRFDQDGAPVVAVLDFPRRDGYERAIAAGAGTVLGKPWLNTELIEAIEWLSAGTRRATSAVARAA